MLKHFNNWLLSTYVSKREDAKAMVGQVIGNQRGAGAVEYGLVIAVIVIMIIAAAAMIDSDVQAFFKGVINKVIKQAGI